MVVRVRPIAHLVQSLKFSTINPVPQSEDPVQNQAYLSPPASAA